MSWAVERSTPESRAALIAQCKQVLRAIDKMTPDGQEKSKEVKRRANAVINLCKKMERR